MCSEWELYTVLLYPLMADAKGQDSYHIIVAKKTTTFLVLRKLSLIPLLAVGQELLWGLKESGRNENFTKGLESTLVDFLVHKFCSTYKDWILTFLSSVRWECVKHDIFYPRAYFSPPLTGVFEALLEISLHRTPCPLLYFQFSEVGKIILFYIWMGVGTTYKILFCNHSNGSLVLAGHEAIAIPRKSHPCFLRQKQKGKKKNRIEQDRTG